MGLLGSGREGFASIRLGFDSPQLHHNSFIIVFPSKINQGNPVNLYL